ASPLPSLHSFPTRRSSDLMALLIVPTTLVSRAPSMWAAILIVGVAAAAHQAWSANVYTLASDMFPKSAVGSVVGIGSFAGAMGRSEEHTSELQSLAYLVCR